MISDITPTATTHTVFISGHKHTKDAEFAEHYDKQIEALLATGTHFVVGDGDGFDTKVQGILHDAGAVVTVFHMKKEARNNVGEFPTQGGFDTREARDAAMTAASDADLAWVRPGREKSGVGFNVTRRAKGAAIPAFASAGGGEDVDEGTKGDDEIDADSEEEESDDDESDDEDEG